jgi:hypothetical protein
MDSWMEANRWRLIRKVSVGGLSKGRPYPDRLYLLLSIVVRLRPFFRTSLSPSYGPNPGSLPRSQVRRLNSRSLVHPTVENPTKDRGEENECPEDLLCGRIRWMGTPQVDNEDAADNHPDNNEADFHACLSPVRTNSVFSCAASV